MIKEHILRIAHHRIIGRCQQDIVQFRGGEIQSGSLIHMATVPPFFLADLSEEAAQDAAGALGVDPRDFFFVQLDAGIFAVSRPEDASLACVAWQKFPGAQWIRADGNPGSTHGGRWQVPPFLALARKSERDDLFLLQAGIRIEEDDHEVARSGITLGPPDFLGGGSLYDAFLDCLEESDPARTMASQLGLKGQESAVRSFIRSARSSQLDAPLVFRVKHGKPDTDVITLHGTLNTLLQYVVLEAKFDVEIQDPPRVHLRKDSLEVLYTDRPAEGSPAPRGDEFVRYFLRLLTNLRNWQKALK